jgi:hypothetical protein
MSYRKRLFYSVRIPNRYFVSLVWMTLPPLFAENTRLTLNRARSEHLQKSISVAVHLK